MMPSHATQKTNRHNNSEGDGNAAVWSSCEAPALSDRRSNLTNRKPLRSATFSRYAITHPTTAMIRIASNRGSK